MGCRQLLSARTHPRDEALVEAKEATTRPNGAEGLGHGLGSVGGHLGLEDLEGLAEGGDLEL